MSPILVRPVREQLEHDRVIRLLQVKLKRRHDVATNIGEDQTVPVRIGQVQIFPDLVLTSADSGREADGDGRSRNRGIGQPPGSDGPMGPPWAARERRFTCMSLPAASIWPAGSRRRIRSMSRKSGAITPSAIRRGSRSSIAPRRPKPAGRARNRSHPKPAPASTAQDRQPARPRVKAKQSHEPRRKAVRREASRPSAAAPAVQSRPRVDRKGNRPAVPSVHAGQAGLRKHLRRPYAPAPQGHGRPASFTGIARRLASGSAARRSTKTPSRSSRNTTRASGSTGRRSSKGKRRPFTAPSLSGNRCRNLCPPNRSRTSRLRFRSARRTRSSAPRAGPRFELAYADVMARYCPPGSRPGAPGAAESRSRALEPRHLGHGEEVRETGSRRVRSPVSSPFEAFIGATPAPEVDRQASPAEPARTQPSWRWPRPTTRRSTGRRRRLGGRARAAIEAGSQD